MRRALFLLVLAGCGSTGGGGDRADRPAPLAIERDTQEFTDDRPPPRPTEEELAAFPAVWDLYRRGDPRWPVERDRFRRRSEGAAYLLVGHLMRHYFRVNAVRDGAPEQLAAVKSELVALGDACAPYLVDLMVLDQIRAGDGGEPFLTDDITRRDCLEMLGAMGPAAVPSLLRALRREDLGPKGRRFAALALGSTRDPAALEPLASLLLHDESWQVRADAAKALGDLGDARAADALTRAQSADRDPTVVKRAREALARLPR